MAHNHEEINFLMIQDGEEIQRVIDQYQEREAAELDFKSGIIFSIIDTTAEQRAVIADAAVQRVIDGYTNPLTAHIALKSLEDVIKRITDNRFYRESVLEAAQRQDGKTFEMHNAQVQVKEAGTRYDYSKTGDSTLKEMQAAHDALTEKIKARQRFLQTIPDGGVADTATGEIIYRPAKSSTTTVAVTLK